MTQSVLPAVLALGGLLGISDCAPGSGNSPYSAAGTGAAPASNGVVVAIRPVPVAGDSATAADGGGISRSGNDVRGTILGAVGAERGPGPDPEAGFEFILRGDDGQTISVVQGNADGLRPGERVVMSMGGRTRLSRTAN